MKKKSNVISMVTPEILARIAKKDTWVMPKGRDWVDVSYEQKEEAKRLGCRWCPDNKRWYASKFVNSKQVELLLRESREKKAKKELKKKNVQIYKASC